jgi:AraC-like DNA-binding protein
MLGALGPFVNEASMSKTKMLPTSYIQMTIRTLASEGISTEKALLRTGLTTEFLKDNDFVTLDQFIKVILNAMKCSNDPAIGLRLGSLLHPSTHGSLGWAAISSRSLSSAIDVFEQYNQIRMPYILYASIIHEDEYIIRLTLTENLQEAHTIFVEAMLMSLQHIIEFILGRPMNDASFHINSEKPLHADSYEQYFHCPVYFDSNYLEIRMPLELKDVINANADRHMHELAIEQCLEAAHQFQLEVSISTEISNYLSSNLKDSPSLTKTAERFDLTPRTIIRRLKAQNTSFQGLKDEVYAFQASSYLRRTSLSVDTISVILGYNDPANFRRSFKRWFGQSPQQYRDELPGR